MRKGLIGLLALAVVVIVGLYAGMDMKSDAVEANGVQPSASATTAATEPVAATEVATTEDAPAAAVDPKTYALGNPDAPVKVTEYASLSCSHCAEFHKNTFPQVKKELIDTGKVYFQFEHFPLNAPAMDGALVAMCMPAARYHQFLSFLFENQAKWAFDANYQTILKQNAKLLGASEEKLDACLADEKKKQEIVKNMQDASAKHNVQSTPSFVINDKVTFAGALPFEEFKKRVEAVAAHDGKVAE